MLVVGSVSVSTVVPAPNVAVPPALLTVTVHVHGTPIDPVPPALFVLAMLRSGWAGMVTALSVAALLVSLLSATTLLGSTLSVAPALVYVPVAVAVAGKLTASVDPAARLTPPASAVQLKTPAVMEHVTVPVTVPVVLVVMAP